MKILLIAALFPPYHRGGAEVAATTVARELSKQHEVTVLTIKPFGGIRSLVARPDNTEIVPGVRAMRFYPLNIFSFIHIARHGVLARFVWHFFDMFNLHSYAVVRRIINELKPDLVLTHNLKGIGYTIPLAIRHRKSPIRWIHTVHDLGSLYPRGVLEFGKEHSFDTTSFLVRIYGGLTRILFGSPPLVVSRSLFFLDYFSQCGWFPQSIKKTFTHDVVARTNSVAAKPQGVFKFIYVGQLESYKGINLLLDAYARARRNGLHGELHIAGTGSERARCEHAAQTDPSVIIHGERYDLDALLPMMHASVVPTLVYENTPLALIEALGAGLPVVASRIGGVSEAFRDGVAGYLVPPGNGEAWSHALTQMAHTREWERLSADARSEWLRYDAAGLNQEIASLVYGSQKDDKAL